MVTNERQEIFRALADPVRRALLQSLWSGPKPVGRLAARFTVSRPAVSKHLKLLRDAGLVSEERRGRERVYRLETAPLAPVGEWITALSAVPRRRVRSAARRRRRPTAEERPSAWRVW